MKKINIAELLKDCPKGMELNCTMFDDVTLLEVIDRPNNRFPIKIAIGANRFRCLTETGGYDLIPETKCVIFPKGKTTWKGFDPFYQFKNGDVVATSSGAWIGITTGGDSRDLIPTYCVIKGDGTFEAYLDVKKTWCFSRLATKEEKEKLFKVIKENGYEWNEKTKIIKKLVEPKFHVGDWVVTPENKVLQITSIENTSYSFNNASHYWEICYCDEKCHLWTIQDAKDGDVLAINWYEGNDSWEKIIIFKKYHNKGIEGLINSPCVEGYGNTFKNGKVAFHEKVPYFSKTWTSCLQPATKEQRDLLFQKIKEAGYKLNTETKTLEKLVELKFKIGDRVKNIPTGKISIIDHITSSGYVFKNEGGIGFTFENDCLYELLPHRFDINNLKPFDSKVLVRHNTENQWCCAFFSHIDNTFGCFCYKYVTTAGKSYPMMIPYKGNEYLRGTTNDCDNFYKIWIDEEN